MWYNIHKWFFGSKIQALILMLTGISMISSLVSYNPDDPSFNLATYKEPENLLQYFGAYLSDLLYQFFGFAAFILPVAILIWSIVLYTQGELLWIKTKFVIVLLVSTGLSISLSRVESEWLPSGYGGAIGTMLYPLISKYGYIADLSLCVISIVLFFFSIGLSTSTSHTIITKFSQLTNIVTNIFAYCGIYSENERAVSKTHDTVTIAQNAKYLTGVADKTNRTHSVETAKRSSFSDQGKHAILPPIDLLQLANKQQVKLETNSELKQNADNLLKVLNDFGVRGKIIDINQGPVVTLYEFEPAAGTKSSRVIGLSDDIARSLSAVSTRIATIPGRNALGIELPNKQRAFFCLRELIETQEYADLSISLPLILGKDLAGKPFVADLAKMPHLLVAGTTGSGKSVAINAMIMSLLYRYTPAECRLIMIDPKMLELSVYDNIPHLLTPVVTESGKAVVALKWAVKEMENRYRLMSNIGVRNITGYNTKITEAIKEGKVLARTAQTGFDANTGTPIYESVPINMEKLPFIVVVVDEMADLMIVAGKDIESSIQRLAQMARAAGIHIIMATQRPSVDVITGVIKANFPSRISFKVTSKIDSRTILGEQGSEQLLGMGDMLYMGNASKIIRVHGPFVDDMEVEKVAEFLRTTGQPEYVSAVIQNLEDDNDVAANVTSSDDDSLYKQAVQIVKLERKVSTSYIQRSLRIGYNRAADIIDKMERNGLISPPNHTGKREILIPEE